MERNEYHDIFFDKGLIIALALSETEVNGLAFIDTVRGVLSIRS
jgi:hypothetical protein